MPVSVEVKSSSAHHSSSHRREEHHAHRDTKGQVLHSLTEKLGLPHFHGEEDVSTILDACRFKMERGQRIPRFGIADKLIFPETAADHQSTHEFFASIQKPEEHIELYDCFGLKGNIDGKQEEIHFHGGFSGKEAQYLLVLAMLGNTSAEQFIDIIGDNTKTLQAQSQEQRLHIVAEGIIHASDHDDHHGHHHHEEHDHEDHDHHDHHDHHDEEDHNHSHQEHNEHSQHESHEEEKTPEQILEEAISGVTEMLVLFAGKMKGNKKIEGEVKKLQAMEFFGQPDINAKLSDELQDLLRNDEGKKAELSQAQERKIKLFQKNNETTELVWKLLFQAREEHHLDTANERIALLLLQMLKPSLKQATFEGQLPPYEKLSSDDVMRVLSLALEIRTRKDSHPQSDQETQILQYETKLRKEGLTYVFHTDKHKKGKMHTEWDPLKGGFVHCPETTPEIAKKIQQIKESVAKQMQSVAFVRPRLGWDYRLLGGGYVEPHKISQERGISSPQHSEPSLTTRLNERPQVFLPPVRKDSKRKPTSSPQQTKPKNEEGFKSTKKPRALRIYHEMAPTGDVLTTPAHVVGRREDADMVIRVAASRPIPDASTTRLSSEISGARGTGRTTSGSHHAIGYLRESTGLTTRDTGDTSSGRSTSGGSRGSRSSAGLSSSADIANGRATGRTRGDGRSEGSYPTDKPKGTLNPHDSAGQRETTKAQDKETGENLATKLADAQAERAVAAMRQEASRIAGAAVITGTDRNVDTAEDVQVRTKTGDVVRARQVKGRKASVTKDSEVESYDEETSGSSATSAQTQLTTADPGTREANQHLQTSPQQNNTTSGVKQRLRVVRAKVRGAGVASVALDGSPRLSNATTYDWRGMLNELTQQYA